MKEKNFVSYNFVSTTTDICHQVESTSKHGSKRGISNWYHSIFKIISFLCASIIFQQKISCSTLLTVQWISVLGCSHGYTVYCHAVICVGPNSKIDNVHLHQREVTLTILLWHREVSGRQASTLTNL